MSKPSYVPECERRANILIYEQEVGKGKWKTPCPSNDIHGSDRGSIRRVVTFSYLRRLAGAAIRFSQGSGSTCGLLWASPDLDEARAGSGVTTPYILGQPRLVVYPVALFPCNVTVRWSAVR